MYMTVTESEEILNEIEFSLNTDKAFELIDLGNSLMGYLSENDGSLKHINIVQSIAERMNYLADAEVIKIHDYSLESIVSNVKDMGVKAYRAICELVRRFINWVMSFFRTSQESAEKQTDRLEQAIADFKQAINESDEVIKQFALTPGQKLTAEQKEMLKSAGKTVMQDFTGAVISGDAIMDDMTKMLSAGRRTDPTFNYLCNDKGQITSLVPTIKQAIAEMERISKVGVNTAFIEYGQKLFNIASVEDFNWLKTDRVKDSDAYVRSVFSTLKPKNHGKIAQTEPFMYRYYPTYQSMKNGDVPYLSFFISGEQGKRSATSQRAMNSFKHDKQSFQDVQNLIGVKADLDTLMGHLAAQAEKAVVFMKKIGEDNGEIIRVAQENLKKFGDENHLELVAKLDKEIRDYPKSGNDSLSLFTNLAKATDQIGQSLGKYIDAMLSIKEMK